jgi:hypothetical protein
MKKAPVITLYVLTLLLLLSPALFTSRVLIPADLLHSYVPWSGETPHRPAHNVMLSDVMEQFYPYYHFLRSELSEGRFPLWNPYVLNGTPFLANTVSAPLSPLHWLLIFLPINVFYEWAAFLKLLLAGTGIYLYCRRIGLPPIPSGAAGAFYMLAGYNVFFLLYPNTAVSALFGWGLLFLEDYYQTNRRRSLALFSLVLGAAYLSGHVESALLHHICYCLYALLRDWRRILQPVLSTLFAISLAAVMLLPFIEFLLNSATFLERSAPGRNPFFLPLGNWPALFVPYFLGSPAGSAGEFRLEMVGGAVYIGIVPFLFVLLALGNRQFKAWMLPLTGLVLFSTCILFGIPPVFDLFTAIPLLRQGNHFHIVQILHGSLAVLAGIGLACLPAAIRQRKRVAVAAGVSAALLLVGMGEQFRRADEGYYFMYRQFDLPIHALWTLAVFLLLAAFLGRRWLGPAVLALALVNGLLFGLFFNPAVDPQTSLDVVPTVVEELRAEKHHRIAGVGVGTLLPNYQMKWRLRDVRGYESVRVDRVVGFHRALTGSLPDPHHFITRVDERYLRVLRKSGASLILSPEPIEVPGLETLRSHFPFLYGISGSERAFVTGMVTAVSSPEEALLSIGSPPDEEVFLETTEVLEKRDVTGSVHWQLDEPDRVELIVDVAEDAWLVLRDTYFPGWTAYVGDQEAQIRRADYLFRAVPVPAGRHRVSFRYSPLSFRYGTVLSSLALVLIVALLITGGGTPGSATRRAATTMPPVGTRK